MKLFPDMLCIGISYAAFPGKLLFNSPDLDEDALEYEWSCAIDLEGDGRPDFSISLSSFKAPKAKPIEASVTLFCQADLWKLTASGGEAVDGDMSVETDGSALPLKKITANTTFTLDTYYGNGKSVAKDSLKL